MNKQATANSRQVYKAPHAQNITKAWNTLHTEEFKLRVYQETDILHTIGILLEHFTANLFG